MITASIRRAAALALVLAAAAPATRRRSTRGSHPRWPPT